MFISLYYLLKIWSEIFKVPSQFCIPGFLLTKINNHHRTLHVFLILLLIKSIYNTKLAWRKNADFRGFCTPYIFVNRSINYYHIEGFCPLKWPGSSALQYVLKKISIVCEGSWLLLRSNKFRAHYNKLI